MSRGRSVLTLDQYKELLRLSAEAKAAGKNMESWKIAYEWGVNVGTLKSARSRGIKHYDVMIRKEQQQKAREAEQQRRLREVNAELLAALKTYEAWADPTICRDAELRAIRIQIRAAIAKAEEVKP